MSAGIVSSMSKIVAVYDQKGEQNNITKTIRVVAMFNIIWAIIIGILVFVAAPLIGKYGVSDTRNKRYKSYLPCYGVYCNFEYL